MNLQATSNEIYSNHTLLAPDGQVICRMSTKKSRWYLDRGLAIVISSNPMVLKLNFEPKGRGHEGDQFYLGNKVDCCVCCGGEVDLTMHHIVPRCFRKHFPEEVKSHDFHDVLPTCTECHNRYELEADKLKKEICKELDVIIKYDGITKEEHERRKIDGYIKTLEVHKDNIPKDRVEFLQKEIDKYLAKNVLAGESPIYYKPFGQLVVEKLDNIQVFVVRWREHFLSVMKPRFMPQGWDVNRIIRS